MKNKEVSTMFKESCKVLKNSFYLLTFIEYLLPTKCCAEHGNIVNNEQECVIFTQEIYIGFTKTWFTFF